MDPQNHWEKIYTEKGPTAVSWYRPHLETSVSLVERVATKESGIIDVGGGESTLFDDLLFHGYNNVMVLDISRRAIEENMKRLGRLQSGLIGSLQTSQKLNSVNRSMTHGMTAQSFIF